MRIWELVKSIRLRTRHSCAKCHLCLCLTGEPPQNSCERLIEEVARGRQSLSFHWLEQEISTALYDEEVRRGAWAVDIGLLGPALFRKEVARILGGMRPEFGSVVDSRAKDSMMLQL